MRLSALAEHLRARGLRVVTAGDWINRGSGAFAPRGVVIHHTGPWSTVQGMVDLCIRGRADLPGPLCQVVLAPDGTCHVVAAGRANHAGAGGWKGLGGNGSVAGIEAVHSGAKGTPWPADQRAAYPRAAAAICELIGAPADMVCAHREWAPNRKTDPVNIDMHTFRLEVAAFLAEWSRPAVPMEVPPMVEVPYEIVGKVVAHLKAPGGGVWVLTEPGAIYAFDCDDKGAPSRHDYWGDRKARRLEPLGEGYSVIASDASHYDYP
jgi:hypothetical protein